jgi:Domain of unknown function (DUF4397)
MNISSIPARLLAAISLTITLIACGTENDILRNQIPASGARIKLIHAVTGGPSVDVFANDAKLTGAALAYGAGFPTEYAVVPGGSVNVRVSVPASGTVAAQNILTAAVPLEADKYYTVAAAGTAAAPVAVLIPDDLTVPTAGKNFIRVLNLVSNGPAIDLAIGTGAPLISNVAYKGVSAYVAVDPNAATAPYAFQTRETGKTTQIGATLNFNTPNVGRKYTLILRGLVGGTGAQAPTITQVTNK